MILNPNSMKPIYVQIAEWLEGEILAGNIQAEERIYSQYQLAEMFNINPATAAKGLNILAENDIVYKKRGLGMFVSPKAGEIILLKRKDGLLQQMLFDLALEAERLGISDEDLTSMLRQCREQVRQNPVKEEDKI